MQNSGPTRFLEQPIPLLQEFEDRIGMPRSKFGLAFENEERCQQSRIFGQRCVLPKASVQLYLNPDSFIWVGGGGLQQLSQRGFRYPHPKLEQVQKH